MILLKKAFILILSILIFIIPFSEEAYAKKSKNYKPAKQTSTKKVKQTPAMKNYEEGCSYEKLGLVDKAIEFFELALKEDPKMIAAQFRLASLYDIKGKLQDSKKLYQQILSQDKTFYLAYNNLGIVEYKFGNKDAAMRNWIESLKYDPNQEEVYNNIGMSLLIDEKFEQSIKYFDQALKIKPLFQDAAKNRAYALLHSGQYKEADEQLSKNSKVFSYNPYSYYNYACFCREYHNYSAGIRNMDIATKKKSNEPIFYLEYALNLAYNGEYDEALQKMSESKANPESFEYKKIMGRIYQLKGDYDQALSFYLKAQAQKIANADFYAWFGTLYSEMKFDSKAQETWTEGLAKIKNSPNIYLARAEYKYKKADYSGAIADTNTVLSKNPNSFEALGIQAKCLQKQKQTQQAIELFDKAIDKCPYYYEAFDSLAQIYLEQKDFKKASEIISNAIESNPKQAALYCTLGRIYFDMGNQPQAIRAWMDGLALNGSCAPIYYNLGRASELSDDMDEAKRYYNIYLKHAPDGEYADQVRRKIMNSK